MQPSDICHDTEAAERKPSISYLGQDDEFDFLQQLQEQALEPVKEDIIEWVNLTLGCCIKTENLLSYLDDGIILCNLIERIQTNAVDCKLNKDISVKCKKNAQPGTWFARDNIANFLKWCKMYDIKEECMFETEGLVSHRNEKEVILCLLELSRFGMSVGIEPPRLIALEREIDKKQDRINAEKEYGDDTSNKEPVVFKNKTEVVQAQKESSNKGGNLHAQVREISMACRCEEKFQVNRIGEGHYVIGGKNMFVRLLKGRHLMVRVGGGWDTLQHYMSTHDPCRIKQFRRDGSPVKATQPNDFLHVKGRYKQNPKK